MLLSTFIILTLGVCRAALFLSLNGDNNIIPTDGSGRIVVSDVGQNNFNALLCRSTHVTSTSTSDWYYHPTLPSIHSSDRIIVDDERQRGWTRTRDVNNGTVRLLRDEDIPSPLEGIFTCEIEEDPDSPIFLGIYYTIDVDVHVEVISARKGTFIVTCTAKGGTVLRSSLSGPDGVNYTLNLVGTMNMRGDDTYSFTTGTILRAANGDTYTCIATNRAGNQLAADIDPTDSEKLKVASPPIIEAAEPTGVDSIRVKWSQPAGGATVTGYVVHYSDGITERSLRLSALTLNVNITRLGRNRAYTIEVEATSLQLSGVSYTADVLISDKHSVRTSNFTENTRNEKDNMIITIGAAGAVISVILLSIIIVGVIVVLVTRSRSKKDDKSKGAVLAKNHSRLNMENMNTNAAYNCTEIQSYITTKSSKVTEPIYDLPSY